MQKKSHKVVIFLAVAALLMSGCAMTTLQTANTTPKGNTDLQFNLSAVSGGAVFPELGVRVGLSDNFDAGIKVSGLGFMAEGKLAIFQNRIKGPSLAMIGGFGYTYISDTLKFSIIDFGPILSIKTSFITPYVALKFRRFGFDSTSSDNFLKDFTGEFTIINFGVCLWPNASVSLLLEGSYFKSIELFDTKANLNNLSTFSAGLRFRI